MSGLSRNPYKRSKQQERRAAKRVGGKVTPGSGNGWVKKGDVHTDDLLIEYKTTNNLSYRLFEDELLEAEKEALLAGREAVFGISYGRSRRNWVVIPEEEYLRLREPCTGMHFRPITAEEEEANQW